MLYEQVIFTAEFSLNEIRNLKKRGKQKSNTESKFSNKPTELN